MLVCAYLFLSFYIVCLLIIIVAFCCPGACETQRLAEVLAPLSLLIDDITGVV